MSYESNVSNLFRDGFHRLNPAVVRVRVLSTEHPAVLSVLSEAFGTRRQQNPSAFVLSWVRGATQVATKRIGHLCEA